MPTQLGFEHAGHPVQRRVCYKKADENGDAPSVMKVERNAGPSAVGRRLQNTFKIIQLFFFKMRGTFLP